MSVLNPYKELIEILNLKGFICEENKYGEDFYNDNIFELLEGDYNNIKGGILNSNNLFERFKDVISDPNNFFIKRNKNAGKIKDNLITIHNGIELFYDYYGNFIDILKFNLGVHEPSEERAFQKVLNVLKEGSTMIELGSYWAMYSIWFMNEIKNSKSYCIESSSKNIQLGIKNFSHNGLLGDFTQGMISNNDLNLERFIKEKNIEYVDLLHSDIQGFEFEMLSQIKNYLENYKIKYLFISTHSNKIHYDCIKFLKRMKYKILCSSDFENETFHYDGFILACPEVINEIKEFKIGNRSKSKLISDKLLKQIINQ